MLEVLILEWEKYYSHLSLFFITITTLLIISQISNLKKWSKFKLPPGPRGLPVLGNILGIVKDPHLKLSKWAKNYGELYTIRLVHRKALVVSEIKLLKELFGLMASTGKFKTETLVLMSQGPYGIFNTHGNAWQEQRQFCRNNLKQLGFGRSMEPLILHEVHKLCEWIEIKNSTGIVHLEHVLSQATINSLWTLVTGERFEFEDSEFGGLFHVFIDTLQYTMKTGLGFCHYLKYIAPNLSGFVAYDKACKDIHNFAGKLFTEQKETFQEGKIRNLIDMYIEKMNKVNTGREINSSFYGETGWTNSVSSVVELFAAGGETVSTSLNWACIYLSCNPNIQKKLQVEIDEILGGDRDPSLTDKTRMPYTEAVVLETLRFSSLVPFGVLHELLEDITFHGYTLPKGMILLPNLYHIHHDPEIWGDTEVFRPERFLGDDGDRLKGYIVAFQPGKRQCLGEPLAKDTMFLFIAKLFQQFNMIPDPSVPIEDFYKTDVGLGLLPRTTGLIITSR